MMQKISRLERDPAKAARFYATLYGELADLDDGARALIEERTRQWLQDLQGQGLALPQRPKGNAKEWDARRTEANKQLRAKLVAELPPNAGRQKLDEFFSRDDGGRDRSSTYEMFSGDGQP